MIINDSAPAVQLSGVNKQSSSFNLDKSKVYPGA